jgi:hypothetical protein
LYAGGIFSLLYRAVVLLPGRECPCVTLRSHACVRDGHASHALACACAQEIMDMLRPLTRDEFTTLVTNFYTGLKGRFKIPIFAHHELDLHAVRGCAPMHTAVGACS